MANKYATLDDYESRYGVQGDSASERIEQLLDDAALYLEASVAKYGIDENVSADALTMVCCARARYIEERGDGISSRTQQAGPYSLTTTWQKPIIGFDEWLRAQFGDLLGITGGGVACVAIGFGDEDVD